MTAVSWSSRPRTSARCSARQARPGGEFVARRSRVSRRVEQIAEDGAAGGNRGVDPDHPAAHPRRSRSQPSAFALLAKKLRTGQQPSPSPTRLNCDQTARWCNCVDECTLSDQSQQRRRLRRWTSRRSGATARDRSCASNLLASMRTLRRVTSCTRRWYVRIWRSRQGNGPGNSCHGCSALHGMCCSRGGEPSATSSNCVRVWPA
jgi:hypothetical protein